MKTLLVTLTSILLAAQLHVSALAQEAKQPAFTLRSRVTTNMNDGKKEELKEVRYVSSSGNFRIVNTQEDGSVSSFERVYEHGRGFFSVHHGLKFMVKNPINSPETATTTPPTTEQLRASPNFIRTEEVLGRTTYVHRIKDEKTGEPQADYYLTPELGRVPLKTVEYEKGKVFRVTEPISVAFGEPDAAQVKLPEYDVEEMMPVSGGVLNKKATHSPAPAYPAAAKDAGIMGVVTVQVLLNEDGTVKVAKASYGPEQLRAAAVEAALKARFRPTLLSGKPVKVGGVITYNFVLR